MNGEEGLGKVLTLPSTPDAIELRHLRAFVAVAEELNFGRAAARLYLSAPALSRQISALERLVGCLLLRRSTHRVELTLAGESLLTCARELIRDLDSGIAATRAVGGELSSRANRFWEPVAELCTAGVPIQELRAAYEGLHAQFAPPPEVGVRPVNAGGVPALRLTPGIEAPIGLLYLHGGGFSMGSAFGYRPLAGALAVAAEASVLVPEFRLAPEHPHPAAVEDAVRAYLWLIDQDLPAERIVVAGDSSGGGLVMSLLLTLRDRDHPQPGGAALLCPGLDITLSTYQSNPTNQRQADMSAEQVQRFIDAYLAGHPSDDPILNPLTTDLTGLPPLLIQAAIGDYVAEDSHRLADNARRYGVEAELELYPADTHVFQIFWSFLPEAADAVNQIGRFVRAASRGSATRREPRPDLPGRSG